MPVGARFFAPVQTGPGTHSPFYTMGTGSFPGVKQPKCGVNNPPPSTAEVKESVDLYFFPFLGLHGTLQGEIDFYVYLVIMTIVSSCDVCLKLCTHFSDFYCL
jgi:hypothetical protein